MSGSKRCNVGCTCGRHKWRLTEAQKKRREALTCTVIEDGQRCTNPTYNIKQGLCRKHYARWQRHGTVQKLPNSAQRGVHPATLAKREQVKANKAKRAIYVENLHRCMCSHTMIEQHAASRPHRCMYVGCNCKAFDVVNEKTYTQRALRLAQLCFIAFLNDTAVCTMCKQSINIGNWSALNTESRALRHYKECLTLQRFVENDTRPNRADAV